MTNVALRNNTTAAGVNQLANRLVDVKEELQSISAVEDGLGDKATTTATATAAGVNNNDVNVDDADSLQDIGIEAILGVEAADELLNIVKSIPNIRQNFYDLQQVGQGTFSTVYKAKVRKREGAEPKYDVDDVALKVIYEHSSSQRVKGEVLCLHKLRSLDCTIEIFDVFHHKNINVMVLEYVESESEQSYLSVMNVNEIRSYMRGLMLSLKNLHSHGVIHRDIKPQNFLFSRKTRECKLIDFNLAVFMNENEVVTNTCSSSSTCTSAHPAVACDKNHETILTSSSGVSKKENTSNMKSDGFTGNGKKNSNYASTSATTTTTTTTTTNTTSSSKRPSVTGGNKRRVLSSIATEKDNQNNRGKGSLRSSHRFTKNSLYIMNKALSTTRKRHINSSRNLIVNEANSRKVKTKEIATSASRKNENNNPNPLLGSSNGMSFSSNRSNTNSSGKSTAERISGSGGVNNKSSSTNLYGMSSSTSNFIQNPTTSSHSSSSSALTLMGVGNGINNNNHVTINNNVVNNNSNINNTSSNPLINNISNVSMFTGSSGSSKNYGGGSSLNKISKYRIITSIGKSDVLKKDNRILPRIQKAGTRGYRAPEALIYGQTITPAVDIWAAGKILLSIASKQYPFSLCDEEETDIVRMLGIEQFAKHSKNMGYSWVVDPDNMLVNNSNSSCFIRIVCEMFQINFYKRLTKLCSSGGSNRDGSHNANSPYGKSLEYIKKETKAYPDEMYDLLRKCLIINPADRITAIEALQHPFLSRGSVNDSSSG